jgi:hypothetical protein
VPGEWSGGEADFIERDFSALLPPSRPCLPSLGSGLSFVLFLFAAVYFSFVSGPSVLYMIQVLDCNRPHKNMIFIRKK